MLAFYTNVSQNDNVNLTAKYERPFSASTDLARDFLENLLLNYTDWHNYSIIRNSMTNLQVDELLGLLLYSESKHPEFGVPFVQCILYENSRELAYVNIVFENCNWNEWKSLELELMDYQNTLKGMVAVTCLSGLKE